jgi:CubicO group peptidase (beta-lactamase class C family)
MKKNVYFLFLALFLTAVSGSLAAAQSVTDDPGIISALKLIEIWVEGQSDYQNIPGVSAGIIYDQKLIWSQGFGFADLERKAPATPATIYSICSISKLFTSIAVMQLRDKGKLSLDEPVRTYLSWFKIKDKYPDAPEITLRGILTHSAGLPREAAFPYWTGPDYEFPSREEIIAKLSSQEELYPAETYYQYSNLGLTLAGEVVAAVSGEPFADYVEKNILGPLGMKATTPEIPEAERGKRLAVGYSTLLRDGSRRVVPFFLVRGLAPAAGFASTVEDLARFASWQLRLLQKGGKEVLNANTLKEMQRVQWMDADWQNPRGIGFSVWRRDNKSYVGHGGACPGYRTQVALCPKDKIAVIVLTNADDANPDAYVREIFDIAAPAITQAAEGPGKAKKPDRDLSKFVGRYERPIAHESHVLIWEDGLGILFLPNDNPSENFTKLRRIKGNVFQRVRDDGELGEEIVFETGPDGKILCFIWNSQRYDRL